MFTIRSRRARASSLRASTAPTMARSAADNEGLDCAGSEKAVRLTAATMIAFDRSNDLGMVKNLSSRFAYRAVIVLIPLSLVCACENMAKERQRSQSGGYVNTD